MLPHFNLAKRIIASLSLLCILQITFATGPTKYITIGQDATIHWAVGGGAASCSPIFDSPATSGSVGVGPWNAWTGSTKPGTGAYTFAVADGTNFSIPGTFTLRCIDTYAGTVADTATIDVKCPAGTTWNGSICAYPVPSATFTASPGTIPYNTPATLTWSSTDATSCTAGGAWSNNGTLAGSDSTGNLISSQTYTFYCNGPGGQSPTVSITVTVNPPANCTLPWGGTLLHGQSVTAYQSATVNAPATCTPETRTCNDGVPSGSYMNQTCTVLNQPPNPPTITGNKAVVMNTSHTYTFTAKDPNNDQIRYGIDWNMDDVADEWLPAGIGYVNSGTAQSTNRSFSPPPGTKTFQALAQDAPGLNSTWTTYQVNACPPGHGSDGDVCVDPPTLTASISPSTVAYGGYFNTLKYNSTGATSCTGSINNGAPWATALSYEWGVNEPGVNQPYGPWYNDRTWTFTCYNSTGQSSSISVTLTVRANTNPNAPSITGPTTGFPSTTYEFDITGKDLDGDTIKYEVDWDMNGTVDQTIPSSAYVTSETMQPVYNDWASIGDKTFQARTVDVYGGRSLWTTHTISINPLPSVLDASIDANCGVEPPSPKLALQCSGSNYYEVRNSANNLTSSGNQSSATINIPDTNETYNVVCKAGGSTGTASSPIYRSYSTTMCTPKAVTLNANPRTISKGGASSLSWTIIRPAATCTLTAQTVCTGGHGACTQDKIAAENAINQIINTGNTDANDTNNGASTRTILNAIQKYAPGVTGKALGKKTFNFNFTTDFDLNCGGGVQEKVRVQVTNDNEG
jgi:hypothetical protein